MTFLLDRRALMAGATAAALSLTLAAGAMAQDKVQLRLSAVQSETDQRSVAMMEKFAPMVEDFASFEPHWNGTLFGQGTELEAIASGDLEMSITSAQELATFFPEFSIFTAGYILQDADHQVAVFKDPLFDQFKQKAEDELGVVLLAPMYLGRRQVNLRQSEDELKVMTPADLSGVNLRMPGTDAWQFLGKALGANPTPMALSEVFTALQQGTVDGQDNPVGNVKAFGFDKVQGNITLSNHQWAGIMFLADDKMWAELPDEVKTLSNATSCASIASRAPSCRSIATMTPSTFAPAARSTLTASTDCPPDVAMSSSTMMCSPCSRRPSSCFAVP